MNENTNKNRAEKARDFTTDTPDNFKERLGKLSPFQRPILPPSYYPFACKSKPKKNLGQRRSTGHRLPGEKLRDLPIICHLNHIGVDTNRLNHW